MGFNGLEFAVEGLGLEVVAMSHLASASVSVASPSRFFRTSKQ